MIFHRAEQTKAVLCFCVNTFVTSAVVVDGLLYIQMRCHCNEVVSQSGPKPVFRSIRRRWAGHWDNWSQLFGRRRLCQILLHLSNRPQAGLSLYFVLEQSNSGRSNWSAVLQTLPQYACQPLCLSQELSVPGRIIIFHRWDCHATAVVGPDRSTHLPGDVIVGLYCCIVVFQKHQACP